MTRDRPAHPLITTLDEALALLHDHGLDDHAAPLSDTPLPSLLEQCEAFAQPRPDPVLRSVHHLACSGGTVISKCLAAMPGTVLLSEIDPLSRMRIDHADRFAPTDLLIGLRRSPREVPEDLLVEIFQASVSVALKGLAARGQTLVLRDHAHSQFCTETDTASRPTLNEILAATGAVRSVVTLRHPLDVFLALHARNWIHFSPSTLEEFALRASAFLDRHDGIPVVLYEDFTAHPDRVLEEICGYLDMCYSPLATDLSMLFSLSGDSGRSGAEIAPRPRREIPEEIMAQRTQSPAYAALCARFGYEP